jgi:predicted secreted protein
MNLVTGIAVYFVTWWVVLFAVLPLGTNPVAEADSSSGWRGAPEHPRLLRKALITTVVSAVLWVGFYFLASSNLINFRSGWLALPTG